MKKILAIILAAAMLLCFCACGEENAPDIKEVRENSKNSELDGKVYRMTASYNGRKTQNHTLTLGEGGTFALKMVFSDEITNEKLKPDASECYINDTYDIKGTYTVAPDGRIIPTVTSFLFRETFSNATGLDITDKGVERLQEYFKDMHESGRISDEYYPEYVEFCEHILKGDWIDTKVATFITIPEFLYFELNNTNMTFTYTEKYN